MYPCGSIFCFTYRNFGSCALFAYAVERLAPFLELYPRSIAQKCPAVGFVYVHLGNFEYFKDFFIKFGNNEPLVFFRWQKTTTGRSKRATTRSKRTTARSKRTTCNIKHDHLYINVIVPILTGQLAVKLIFLPPGSVNRAFLLQK